MICQIFAFVARSQPRTVQSVLKFLVIADALNCVSIAYTPPRSAAEYVINLVVLYPHNVLDGALGLSDNWRRTTRHGTGWPRFSGLILKENRLGRPLNTE